MTEETSEDKFFRELAETCSDLRHAFAEHVGMSAQRVQALVRLRRAGETSHSALRRAMGLDGATVTRLVKQFEVEGLAGRRLDPADNRYTLAALTSAGEQVATALEQSHQAYQERLLAGIGTAEQETVLRTLRRIRTNMTEQER